MKDFFISYTSSDENMATWIAAVLEKEGYTTVIQAWDFNVGDNFVERMNDALINSKCLILVLSNAYFDSNWCRVEWISKLAEQVSTGERKILPIRIEPVNVTGLLSTIVYKDIYGKTEEEAKTALLDAISIKERGNVAYAPNYNVEHLEISNSYYVYDGYIELHKKCKTKILVPNMNKIHHRVTWFENEKIKIESKTSDVEIELLDLKDTNTNYNVVFTHEFEEGDEVEYEIKIHMENKYKQFKDFFATEIISPIKILDINVEFMDKPTNRIFTQKSMSSKMNSRTEQAKEHIIENRYYWRIEKPEMNCEYKIYW